MFYLYTYKIENRAKEDNSAYASPKFLVIGATNA